METHACPQCAKARTRRKMTDILFWTAMANLAAWLVLDVVTFLGPDDDQSHHACERAVAQDAGNSVTSFGVLLHVADSDGRDAKQADRDAKNVSETFTKTHPTVLTVRGRESIA